MTLKITTQYNKPPKVVDFPFYITIDDFHYSTILNGSGNRIDLWYYSQESKELDSGVTEIKPLYHLHEIRPLDAILDLHKQGKI